MDGKYADRQVRQPAYKYNNKKFYFQKTKNNDISVRVTSTPALIAAQTRMNLQNCDKNFF